MKKKPSIAACYRQTTLSTPAVRILDEVLAGLVCVLYWLRWELSRPFKVNLLPKWTGRISIPGLPQLAYRTYGELVLALPILFLVALGYYFMFGSPDVELSGNIASYAIILGFLTANKSCSIFSFLLGIPFERMLGYHKLCAAVALTIASAHVYLAFEEDHGSEDFFHFAVTDVTNTLGSLIFICTSGLFFTSIFPFLRRWNYDAWLFIHIGLAVTLALPWACHSVNMVWIPLFWFVLDMFVRYILMARCFYARTATLRRLRSNVIEVRFPKPHAFQYNPGQFVRIAVPELSSFQFHPFSISSAPHEEFVTLHIRAMGDWTKKLLTLAGEDEPQEIQLLMEGPYGSVSVDLAHPRYGMVLCVSGGIGVTHCRSVARSLIHNQLRNGRTLEQLRFVWAVREHDLVDDLPPFEDHNDKTGSLDNEVALSASDDGWSTDGVSCSDDDMFPLVTPSVRAEIYVTATTNPKSRTKLAEENTPDLGESYSNQQHHFVVHDGQRPNLHGIVQKMKLEAQRKGITHIAAFGCGPRPLTDALREACRKESKGLVECQGVTIDLHVETFEF